MGKRGIWVNLRKLVLGVSEKVIDEAQLGVIEPAAFAQSVKSADEVFPDENDETGIDLQLVGAFDIGVKLAFSNVAVRLVLDRKHPLLPIVHDAVVHRPAVARLDLCLLVPLSVCQEDGENPAFIGAKVADLAPDATHAGIGRRAYWDERAVADLPLFLADGVNEGGLDRRDEPEHNEKGARQPVFRVGGLVLEAAEIVGPVHHEIDAYRNESAPTLLGAPQLSWYTPDAALAGLVAACPLSRLFVDDTRGTREFELQHRAR